MFVKKRSLILFTLFTTALIVTLLGFILLKENEIKKYERNIAYTYQQSFSDLADTLLNIDSAMQKAMYTDSPYQAVTLAAIIWKEAGAAKSSMDSLPLYDLQLSNTSKFYNQAGDYIMTLAKKILRGEEISEEERKNMQEFSSHARELAASMNGIQEQILEDNMEYDDLLSLMKRSAEGSKKQSDIEKLEDVTKMSAITYDGPFSDHILTRESIFLKNKKAITEKAALANAAAYLGVKENTLTPSGDINSRQIKCYAFSGENIDIYITKLGGFIYSFSKQREIGDVGISNEQAIEKAKEFLDKINFTDMKDTYYVISGNIITINFAYLQGGNVLCYSDLVKVGVALDNGEIVTFSSNDYLMMHHRRTLKGNYTREEAENTLNKDLVVEDYKLAVIPTSSYSEKYCHEFTVKTPEGGKALIYVNAQNGTEENIIILYEDENGTLTA